MSVYSQLEKLCQERGISISNLAEKTGLNRATFSAWKRGAKPKNSSIKTLADYFGVGTEYLLGDDEGTPSKWDSAYDSDHYMPLSSQEKQILDMFRGVSEMGRLRMIQSILRVWDEEHFSKK